MPRLEIPVSTSKRNPRESIQSQKAHCIWNKKHPKEGGCGLSLTMPQSILISEAGPSTCHESVIIQVLIPGLQVSTYIAPKKYQSCGGPIQCKAKHTSHRTS